MFRQLLIPLGILILAAALVPAVRGIGRQGNGHYLKLTDLDVRHFGKFSYLPGSNPAPIVAYGAPRIVATLIKERTVIESAFLKGEVDQKRGRLVSGTLSGDVLITIRTLDSKYGQDHLTHVRSQTMTYIDRASGADATRADVKAQGGLVFRSEFAPLKQTMFLKGSSGTFNLSQTKGAPSMGLDSGDIEGPVEISFEGDVRNTQKTNAAAQSIKHGTITGTAGHLKIRHDGGTYTVTLTQNVLLKGHSDALAGDMSADDVTIVLNEDFDPIGITSGSQVTTTIDTSTFPSTFGKKPGKPSA